jgi:hypothetical protein
MKANKQTSSRKLLLMGSSLIFCSIFAAMFVFAADEPGVNEPAVDKAAVQVEPTNTVGPRTLEKQTETAVVRDYLDAWRSMSAALAENRAQLLDADFVGTAKQKLTDTIHEQAKLGIETRYRDTAHDLRLTFYSPEGMSLQLLDSVDYQVEIVDHGKVIGTQPVHARYVTVLTPTEVRWKVRVFQAEPQ